MKKKKIINGTFEEQWSWNGGRKYDINSKNI